MKKSLFLAVLATIALASCTQNEDFSQPEKISFNPVNYKAQSTKAPITTTYYKTTDPSFGIFAFHSEKEWDRSADADLKQYVGTSGSSVQIKYNTQWKAVSDYYWPLSGSLTFIGYTPYNYGGGVDGTPITASYAKATKTLTISNFSAANQDDLMYTLPSDAKNLIANEENYNNGSTVATYDGVPIKFRHALSQIVVTAKVADEYTGATFTINSISLQGMNDNATLTVTESASWSETSNDEAEFNIPSSVTDALSTTATPVGKPVLVIPQDLENNQQKLVISYSMTFNGVETTTTPAKEIVLATTDLEELAMGKKYTLNLTLYADRILYSPSVAVDWSDGGSDYDVPEQPAQNP